MALTHSIDSGTIAAPGATQATLDVSVVVVTWNSGPWIARCIAALDAACAGLTWEAIVHDNASRDATAAIAAGLLGPGRGQVVRSAQNDGFAGGVNRAVALARGSHVLLLNPDCELEPGCVATLVERLRAHGNAVAAAPLLLGEDGRPQREFQLRRFPTLRTFAAELFLTERLFGSDREIDRYRCRDLDVAVEQMVEQPAGAALLLRREAFAALGPLDERFAPAWFEDVDFCKRIAEAGREILFVPSARATHHGGASLVEMETGAFVEIWYRNLWRYAEKWLTRDERERLRWYIIAGIGMRAGAVLAGHSAGGARRGTLAAYGRVIRSAWMRWNDASRS
ncbi:MAG: glycosyltransferase family 2 protein [Thermoanaerobaculia bacterium]